jgi:prevent-host-death family protein
MRTIRLQDLFKARALEFLRQVESGCTLVVTDRGRPVVRLSPIRSRSDEEILAELRGSVLRYDDPTEPVGLEDWEAIS